MLSRMWHHLRIGRQTDRQTVRQTATRGRSVTNFFFVLPVMWVNNIKVGGGMCNRMKGERGGDAC
jgi:hypothetical protein